MNQRLKRKIEKRRRQQICEALDLCLQINGLQKSEKELTGNHPTAIMHFWGHIGMVDGDFYASGWSREAVVTRHFEERLDRPGKMGQILCELRQLKKDLHSGNCGRSKNKIIHPYYKGE